MDKFLQDMGIQSSVSLKRVGEWSREDSLTVAEGLKALGIAAVGVAAVTTAVKYVSGKGGK